MARSAATDARGSAGTRRRSAHVPTILDVARRAGVGSSTVSRVLNDGQVSGAARARVLEAIEELDYRPSASARALVSGSTGTIGIVIPFFTHPSAVERVRGVLDAVDATSHELVVYNVAHPDQRDEYLGRRSPLDRTDGLLVVSLAPRDDEAEAFIGAGVPVVLVDAHHPRLPRVVVDDVLGGRMATRHLLDLGHRRVAFVGDAAQPRFGFVASASRFRGYRAALRAAGVPFDPMLQRVGPHGRTEAHRLTRELLSLPEPPTAIFAASDTQALGVLEAAGFEGFAVPDDLSVIGFDDLEVSTYVGLTTVCQPLQESGRRGVERLIAEIEGDRRGPLEERLDLTLVVRRTTAPPR